MESKYNYKTIEENIYKFWISNNLFTSKKNKNKKNFTVVMPPPNVKGILHMGHVLNNTIQDILVRKARMQQYETCWVPGTDHASIATEAKVVNLLKEQGISKIKIGRDKFLDHAWEWKNKYGDIIISQLKKLGLSCDWDRNTFTLDDHMYSAVQKIFVKLFDDGLIYRGNRMVYWDPVGKTSISDDEVIYKEATSQIYYIKYKIVGKEESITVATTRPETIFGDTAICCNPNDIRYTRLKGYKAVIPILNREIPIVFDDYVDINFGTGCLKVTPAHDMNDYAIAKRLNLDFVNIMNEDATLNEKCLHYAGIDRFIARKKIVKELSEQDVILKVETISNSVGHSERTDAVVEPRVSTQWFLRMEKISKPALEAVLSGDIKFYPDKFSNMYKAWMENVHDWCISRQLWWGHRIPAYFTSDGKFVVALTIDDAVEKARLLFNNNSITEKDLTQDEDVLDTWFSSWIWPIEVFKGISSPNNDEFNYYYPTNDLVTAPEIIFFWVARMIIAGLYFTNTIPFKNVYFTGIVRDKLHRKMSKSLGNSPDPLELIDKYGADGVRAGMIMSSTLGNDSLFDEKLCEQGRNFANKLWNASLLINKWTPDSSLDPTFPDLTDWIFSRLSNTIKHIDDNFEHYRISQAFTLIYKFFWDDFCAVYLEAIKSSDNKISLTDYNNVLHLLKLSLQLLHPFIPFITEEIWQHFFKNDSFSISHSTWPSPISINESLEKEFSYVIELSTAVRNYRNLNNIKNIEQINLYLSKSLLPGWFEKFVYYIKKVCNIYTIADRLDDTEYAVVEIDGHPFFFDKKNNDLQNDITKLSADLDHLKRFLNTIDAKLNNEKFLANATDYVITNERKKRDDTVAKIGLLELLLNKK